MFSDEALPHAEILQSNEFQVVCRLRPLLPDEKEAISQAHPATQVRCSSQQVSDYECVDILSKTVVQVFHEDNVQRIFPMHSCYSDTSIGKSNFYKDQIHHSLNEIVIGNRGVLTVLAYGQTTSGKTYSSVEVFENAALDLWDYIQKQDRNELILHLEAFELRGESCFDLLSAAVNDASKDISINPGSSGPQGTLCSIREGGNGVVYVACRRIAISSLTQLQTLLRQAYSSRCKSPTQSNDDSSRSHAFYRIYLSRAQIHEIDPGSKPIDNTNRCMLQIVDLAGNERWEDATGHTTERIQEMKSINYSLGCFKECARMLLKGGENKYIPYRRSKLTMLLRDQLASATAPSNTTAHEPHANSTDLRTSERVLKRLLLIAHLSPLRSSIKHTLNTLNFVHEICTRNSRAEAEAHSFKGPLAWTPSDMVAFVAELENGKYKLLSDSFNLTGKMFSIEWIGHVQRRASAAGGTEADGTAIYDAFHELLGEFNKKQRNSSKVPGTGGSATTASASKISQERLKARQKFATSFQSEDGEVLVLAKHHHSNLPSERCISESDLDTLATKL